MSSRLRATGYAVARALGNLRRRPVTAAATAGVLGIAVVLCGLARVTGDNLDRIGDRFGGGVQMIVFLEDGIDGRAARDLAGVLVALDAVEEVTYVPPAAALDHARASLGGHGDLLEGVEEGFLPASLEVTLVDGTGDLAAMHPLAQRLEATPGIEGVEFSGELTDRITGFVGRLRTVGTFLFALALVAGGVAVWATMRAAAPARSRQERILELVGASAVHRRTPAVVEGALLGLLGGVAALLTLALLYRAGARSIEDALALALGGMDLAFLSDAQLAALVALGVGLGSAGGLLTRKADAA